MGSILPGSGQEDDGLGKMMYFAPIVGGIGQAISGISGFGAAKSQSELIGQQTENDVRDIKNSFKDARAANIAQTGASGLSMTSQSFMNIAANNAVNMAQSVAERRYAGAVAQAQAEQASKNALVGGLISGATTTVGGIIAAKQMQKMLAAQRGLLAQPLDIMTPKE